MRRLLALSLGLAAFAAPAAATHPHSAHPPKAKQAHVKARGCSSTEAEMADQVLLKLKERPDQLDATAARHLPWGPPIASYSTQAEKRLVQPDYVVSYDLNLRVPIWTAEQVVASRLDDRIKRQDCFRQDPRLDADASSLPSDYKEPIYDQGHLTPFADQRYSKIAGWNSFIMTNMAPQNCQLNRGIWQILEQISRRWAARHEPLYVFNGTVFDRDGDGRRDGDAAARHMASKNGKARVAIPSAFYKVAAYEDADGTVESVAVLLPHDESNPQRQAALQYLDAHVTDLATIARLTGLKLFPNARSVRESKTLWAFDGYQPNSLCHQKKAAARRPGR